MANVSAFGFGGYDYIGSAGELYQTGQSNIHYLKKSNKINTGNTLLLWKAQQRMAQEQMQFQNTLNRDNQIWSANTMPSATVAGLRKANLNPLLAYSDFSGLASSGAMGVSPSAPSGNGSGGTVEGETTDHTSGFDGDAIDRLRYRKFAMKQKQLANDSTEAAIESCEANSAKAQAETAKTKASMPTVEAQASIDAKAQATRSLAAQAQAEADISEARARSQEAEFKAYLLGHEANSAKGKLHIDMGETPAAAEFWNDFYREKRDLQRYMNSATRQKVLDATEVGAKAAGAAGDLIPAGRAIKAVKARSRK